MGHKGGQMNIEEYLRLVANKVQEARSKNDLAEAKRVLELCATTCIDKAKEIQED